MIRQSVGFQKGREFEQYYDRLLPLWCLRQSFRLTGGSVVRIYTAFLTSARVSDPVRYLPDPSSEPTSQKETGSGSIIFLGRIGSRGKSRIRILVRVPDPGPPFK